MNAFDPEARRRLVAESWSSAWDDGDVDALDRILAPDYRRRTSSDDEGLDREAFKATILTTRAAFPDLSTTIDDLVVEGDKVAVRWHTSGTHSHPFLGVPATKRRVEVYGATFSTFGPDGLIHAEDVTWDPRGLLTAIGVITVGQDQ